MIVRLVSRGIVQRRHRIALALAALTVASTLATALLGLYSDIERKLRRQFRSYGANLILAPAGNRPTIPIAAMKEAKKYGSAAPFLYSVQTANGEPAVFAGVDFGRMDAIADYWWFSGRHRPGPGECLIGERVAQRFGLRPGDTIDLAGERRQVAGVVSTGAAEDSQVLLPLEDVARRSGLTGAASVIAIRAESTTIERAREALAAALPEADVRILRSVVESEAAVVLKIRGTLSLLSLLVLAITVLCVMNNFGAIVYQRRKEIGILKAIGGADRRISALFLAEVAVVAVLGSLAGFALGSIVARQLGRQIFHEASQPALVVLPLVAGITVAAALVATIVPLHQIRRIEPAVTLRGE